MIEIDHITTKNNVFLAPMSGVSDTPFRKAAYKQGAGLVVSEMVASEELVKSRPDVVLRATNDQSVRPFVVQLAGREAKWMAEGAKVAEANGADIIDINMGCPARQVTGALSGSALMRDADHALGLIEATVRAVSVPVTLKMRLGWDHQSLNAPEIGRRAAEAGVKMLVVHGRTRQQFYKGQADWSAVKDTVRAVSVPVIVNGDILNGLDAEAAIKQSGAAGVMVGRAAEGQPWLLKEIADFLSGKSVNSLSLQQKLTVAINHYTDTVEHYTHGHNGGEEMGRALGIRMSRKHLASYLEKLDRPIEPDIRRQLKSKICRSSEPAQVIQLLEQAFVGDINELKTIAA